jgi:two-component system OmpR family response regulator
MLVRQGYQASIYPGLNEARQAFTSSLPDLVILDIGLGDAVEGGFELCRELRSQSEHLPIIMLSARDSDYDIVSGLRLGADDYATKDISREQLLARVSALLRRARGGQNLDDENRIQQGELQIDLNRMAASWKSQPLDLTLTEFWMMHALAKFPGHLRTRQQLMDAANVVLDDNTITSYIKRIRKKFQQVDPEFDAIKTAYGMGYRWVEAD